MVAVYIINRLPTPVLDNKTPYECLYGDLPDYSVMKIFGCLAFSTNPTHTTDKFDPRGVPCVFLGYPALQKGYRLLNLLTMQPLCPEMSYSMSWCFPTSQLLKQPT